MAVTEMVDDVRPWRHVVWETSALPSERLEARFGDFADELVIRWDGFVPVPAVSDVFEECDAADIGVLIDWRTGNVVGVHVCPLLHGAAAAFPHWAAVAQPGPPAEAVAALVADVRRLFEQHGLPPRGE
jgi:hypothetical protein